MKCVVHCQLPWLGSFIYKVSMSCQALPSGVKFLKMVDVLHLEVWGQKFVKCQLLPVQ